MKNMTIDISSSTIFRTILIILAFVFVFYIADILLLLFISFVIVSAVTPLVDRLENYKIPRTASASVIYLGIVAGLGGLISLAIPSIVDQGKQLIENIPAYWSFLTHTTWFQYLFSEGSGGFSSSNGLFTILGRGLTATGGGIFSQAGSLVARVFYLAVLMSLSFYMTIEKHAINKVARYLLPREHETYVISLIGRIQDKMGRWLQGQLLLNVIVGGAVYLVLVALGVPYAFVLALAAGFLEFIPNIGPTISAVLATLVALTINPITAVFVIIAFVIIQQLENQLLVPMIMKKAVGLNPVVIIVVLLVGARLGGPLGAIMAVPLATAFTEFLGDLLDKSENPAR